MRKNKSFISIILVLYLSITLNAKMLDEDKKVLYTNLIGSGVIVTWGILNWDYGDRTMHTSSEGWFSKDTKYGGADKLGHFYTTYALTHFFANLYSKYGFEQSKAIKQGALSSLFFNTIMEIGDSFSDYGFSYEDCIANIVGSYLGYYLLNHPDIHDKVDIRVEYKPSDKITKGDSYDILTDYEGMKFLTAIKFDGFESLKDTYLKYFEFHLGYYTRKDGDDLRRTPYVAIGINLSHLFKPVNRKISKFFNFYQLPYSYLPTK